MRRGAIRAILFSEYPLQAERRQTVKTCFVVADVHSFYDEMIAALDGAGFDPANPDHIFVCLGDLLDRGDKPLE